MKVLRSVSIVLVVFLMSNCKPLQKTAFAMLEKNAWELGSLKGTNAISDLFPEGLPYLEFKEAGAMNGFTGCNSFSGIYSLEGESLKLDPGAMTRKACPGPGENDFLNSLMQVTSFKGDSEKLTLFGDTGELMTLIPKNN